MASPARLVIAALLIATAGPPAHSQPAAEFFAGKQITLLIGTTPGGGYDAYARALARHIGRHIAGHPAIVPKNMPGAGGLTLANHLYNRAPKDGTEIATTQNGLPFEKLFFMLSPNGSNALFDSTRFGWLGSMTQTVFVVVTWHTSPVKTLQDAMARETILGASTTSADSYVLAMLSNNLLGTKFKVVLGYGARPRSTSRSRTAKCTARPARTGPRSPRRGRNGSRKRRSTSSCRWG